MQFHLSNQMSTISSKSSHSSSTQTSSSENLFNLSKTTQIKFTWTQSDPNGVFPRCVYITGSFCKWKHKFQMHPNVKEKLFELSISLPKGVFYFKFIVDDKWEVHSSYATITDNGFVNNCIDTSTYFAKPIEDDLFRNKRLIACPECYCKTFHIGRRQLNHVQHCHCLMKCKVNVCERMLNVCATQRVRNKTVIVVYYKRNDNNNNMTKCK